jgi:hypothetical protein
VRFDLCGTFNQKEIDMFSSRRFCYRLVHFAKYSGPSRAALAALALMLVTTGLAQDAAS